MLDEKQVNAVAARIELDLRIGYAFTRFLSNNLKSLGGPLSNLVISYGEHSMRRAIVVVVSRAVVGADPGSVSWLTRRERAKR